MKLLFETYVYWYANSCQNDPVGDLSSLKGQNKSGRVKNGRKHTSIVDPTVDSEVSE